MPLFLRLKDSQGRITMTEQAQEAISSQELVTPLQPTVGIQVGFKRYSCIACVPPRPFGGLGVLSMHFNKKHVDLVVDKETWRKYVREFGQTGATNVHDPS